MEKMDYSNNLYPCKYCGNMIAKKAKTCPYCGGRNRRTVWGCISSILLIFIIIAGLAIGISLTVDYEDVSSYQSMSAEEYKAACVGVTYEEFARNPSKFQGELMTFTGEVFQKIYDYDGYAEYLIAVTSETAGGEYYSYTYYTDNICAYYYYDDNDKLLEDDIVTIYGEGVGEYTYESVSGAEITVPALDIMYVEFQ